MTLSGDAAPGLGDVVGLFTSPFLFIGTMALLCGQDLGDRIFGIVVLVTFLPGLIALHRWAHPRA